MAKVVIDEGHYNYESGAVGFGIKECDITHGVAYKLKPKLEKQGHSVLITNGSLSNRTSKANSWGADIFISLHCNAFNGNAYGIETFCYKFKYRKLADSIHNALLSDKRLYRTNRGVKEGDLHVIRESNMDACLVEMAFIDNKEDNVLLLKYQDEYATAIAKGVQAYFGLSYKEDIEKPSKPSTPVIKEEKKVDYIIQYSNATDQAIAEVMADRLNCPTINCLRPYAYYGQYKTVIAVGEAKNKSGHTNVLIQGSNRQDTLDKAIAYCKSLGR
ncbi:N-acetylmuramoyl-L-alanine amidase [Clostridium sp.]|uniref:N-acetylmuramoyl-L-alanine amidase family protein n=1 Tax=Clostridium sp. TaxID=1506 RepID=UPI003216F079